MQRNFLLGTAIVLALDGLLQAAVLPALQPHLVNHYTFDDPLDGSTRNGVQLDLGLDATPIYLLNGAPTIADPAWGGSRRALETRQIGDVPGNDDWKAGVKFDSSEESSLSGTNHVSGISLMGWFKPLGDVFDNPSPDTNTVFPFDRFGAFGLFGLLRGDEELESTDGHAVRALLEVINNRVVGLGRRLDYQEDSGSAQSVAPWYEVLPPNQWTHLTATFDFDQAVVRLYRNGGLIETEDDELDNWETTDDVDTTSATNAGGIKIGGSFPDNSLERNPFNGRFDELMTFNRALTSEAVLAQFRLVNGSPGDYDADHSADGSDFLLWQRQLGHGVAALGDGADGDHSGLVDHGDLAVWQLNYGKLGPVPAAATIPEPRSLPLLLCGLLALRRRPCFSYRSALSAGKCATS